MACYEKRLRRLTNIFNTIISFSTLMNVEKINDHISDANTYGRMHLVVLWHLHHKYANNGVYTSLPASAWLVEDRIF